MHRHIACANEVVVRSDKGNLQINTSQSNGTVYIDGIDLKQSLSELTSTQANTATLHDALRIDDGGNLQISINGSQPNSTVYIDGIDVKRSLSELTSTQANTATLHDTQSWMVHFAWSAFW